MAQYVEEIRIYKVDGVEFRTRAEAEAYIAKTELEAELERIFSSYLQNNGLLVLTLPTLQAILLDHASDLSRFLKTYAVGCLVKPLTSAEGQERFYKALADVARLKGPLEPIQTVTGHILYARPQFHAQSPPETPTEPS